MKTKTEKYRVIRGTGILGPMFETLSGKDETLDCGHLGKMGRIHATPRMELCACGHFFICFECSSSHNAIKQEVA